MVGMQRIAAASVVLAVVFGAGVVLGLRLADRAGEVVVDPDAVAVEPGSRADPIPLGEPAAVGDWVVRVVDVDADAEDRILAANQFNQPAGEGSAHVLVEVALERTERGPGVVRGSLSAALASAGDRTWTLGQDCGVVPDALDAEQPVGMGGEVRGAWCWLVPRADVPKLHLKVGGQGTPDVWFALR